MFLESLSSVKSVNPESATESHRGIRGNPDVDKVAALAVAADHVSGHDHLTPT